ncbi:NusG domain II-containing protein [candidate division WOR-3 bacterium]|nr:NusG domain II-containing protein [candidate division WOR-3 bacterium]
MWSQSRHRNVKLKPADYVLVVILLAVSLYLFANQRATYQPRYGVIYLNGKPYYRFYLNKNQIIKVDGPLGSSYVEVKDGRVRMLQSPCPLKLCMKQGWVDKPGSVIICVPNRIVIELKGKPRVDAVTY